MSKLHGMITKRALLQTNGNTYSSINTTKNYVKLNIFDILHKV